jgi:hypothetical protein
MRGLVVSALFCFLIVVWDVCTSSSSDFAAESASVVRKEPADESAGVGMNALEPTSTFTSLKAEVIDSSAKSSCLDPNGPLPVILMSKGRSGSKVTWQVLTNLTGYERPSKEYTGSNSAQSRKFFTDMEGTQDGAGGKWALDYLCKQQKKNPTSGVVGFKWKPHGEILKLPASKSALERFGQLSKSATPVYVVWSNRNPLDKHLSVLKHKTEGVPAHCKEGDIKCLKMHDVGPIEVPETDKLYDLLRGMTSEEAGIGDMLKEFRVLHVHVSYDRLYFPDSDEAGEEEWNKIRIRLGIKGDDWKWNDIARSMNTVSTTKTRSHKEIISNFDQVHAALNGTDMEWILRQD